MTSVTSACLCWTLLSVCVLVLASDEQNTIAAESGEDVTLKCQVTKAKTFRTVKWSRADLGNEYVLLFRDGQSDPEEQHPSFKNRVDLQDTQMKNGDVSLSLKDVTAADEGTYQCRVFVSSWELISTVSLRVQPPGPSGGGSVGLIVGLSVSAVLLLVAVVVGFLIYKKLKPQDSY